MKKFKLMLSFIILIAVLLLIPNMCNAATAIDATETTKTSTGKTVKWSYELNSNNEIIKLSCTNKSEITGSVTIPSMLDEHKVIEIGDGFLDGTFYECTGLTGITFPETLTRIGESAFDGCTGLRNITIPDSVTSIGRWAFAGCSGVKNITFGNGITSIEVGAFQYCTGIKSLIVPNSVTTIDDYAFRGCSGVTSLTLSENLTCIKQQTFENCTGLTSVIIPDSVTTIEGPYSNIYGAFQNCTNLSKVLIPDSVASIGQSAFHNCKNLTIYGNDEQTSKQYAEDNKIKFDYIANWDKKDEGSDITAPTVKSMEIKYSSVMDYYNSTSNRFEIPKGATITINVNFSEDIKGNTAPTLKIKCGTGKEISLTNGVVSGKSCIYTYEIKAGDEGLITAVSLEGGNITDTAGNQAELSCPKLVVQYNSDNTAYANSKTSEIKDPDNKDDNNNEIENPGNKEPEDKNTIIKDDETKDPTIKDDSKLPQTGIALLSIAGIAILVVGVISKVKYNKYKDI